MLRYSLSLYESARGWDKEPNDNTLEDFDNAIIELIVDQFRSEHGMDLRKDRMAMQRVKEAAEKAKIELSAGVETEINLPYISADALGPKHLLLKLNRSKFESVTANLVQRCIDACKRAIKDAGISATDLDEVILVGGTTRIPSVQAAVRAYFGREPNRSVNPDEAVAVGAAVQAGVLSGEVDDVLLLDVTPLSLGLETLNGVMTVLIERNTTIPVRKQQVFSTAENNQSSVTIQVYQGERPMAADNKLLGSFELTGIAPAPRGQPKIEISFDIDGNGILTVSARDQATGKSQDISIKSNGGLSDAEIADMVQAAEANALADRVRRQLAESRNQADQIIAGLNTSMAEHGDQLPEDLITEIQSGITHVQSLITGDDAAAIDQAVQDLSKVSMRMGEIIYAAQSNSDSADRAA